MLFNSLDFALFLPVVFALYWGFFYRSTTWRSVFLTAVSYVFYGWWDYRFLGLIAISTLCDFTIGLALQEAHKETNRKALLWLSILVNLGILGFFKYYNFFIEAFHDAFSVFGYTLSSGYTLEILLPVGISFYTFQTLSYTLVVYRKDVVATRNFWAFAAYVSFFPQLVAGPIERAKQLLPQFFERKTFQYKFAVSGLRLILFGLFKKMVVADHCAVVVDAVYAAPENQSSLAVAIATVCFAIQIYGDFSGYTDIAIGTARLFGFSLSKNFAYPYFSRSIAEFWRRWHISLTRWFKDYLYIPLGGSRGSLLKTIRNVFVIFLVSGFWHGASWNFLLWGAMHAVFFMPGLIRGKHRNFQEIIPAIKGMSGIQDLARMAFTAVLVVLAWVPFRAKTLGDTGSVYQTLFMDFTWNVGSLEGERQIALSLAMACLLFLWEWRFRKLPFAMDALESWSKLQRRCCYLILSLLLIFFANLQETPFIYFQF